MNGEAFAKLTQLESVWMMNSMCIDESFHNEDIRTISEAFATRCKFDETADIPLSSNFDEELGALVVGLAIFVSVFSVLIILWLLKQMCC
jgi:hypothetical protein